MDNEWLGDWKRGNMPQGQVISGGLKFTGMGPLIPTPYTQHDYDMQHSFLCVVEAMEHGSHAYGQTARIRQCLAIWDNSGYTR